MEACQTSFETAPTFIEFETRGAVEGRTGPSGTRSWRMRFPMPSFLLAVAMLVAGCTGQASSVSGAAETSTQTSIATIRGRLSEGAEGPSRGPLTVERAIEEALKASPELEQIRLRVAAAAEQVQQANATFYPRLILSEEYNTTDNPVYALMNIINQRRLQPDVDFNNPGQQQNFSTQVRGQWSLFEGGRRFYERKATLSKRDSFESELLSARKTTTGLSFF